MLEEILKNYKNRVIKDDCLFTKYAFRNAQGDYLDILIFSADKSEVRFIHDNFPFQRKFFATNIPYRNIEDFEADLRRMRIEIPDKL
ncbi:MULTISPECIES: hypothetical protein [Sphingobacterium]|uniref:hypothetical protein n=1 Tax=Sphingobacterium TaxID=28453 RepID=UPI00257E1B0E|nr:MULTISPECIES: hypothetical protein [Sphingobacterium]